MLSMLKINTHQGGNTSGISQLKKAWQLPYKICINIAGAKNFSLKFYTKLTLVMKFMDVDSECALCDMKESLTECNVV